MNPLSRKAQAWLNRNHKLYLDFEADCRTLEIMSGRLGSGVVQYESDGTEAHDADASRARHEDALLDYSAQRLKVERLKAKIEEETARTQSMIDQMSEPELRAVAKDRYINCLRWTDIAMLEHISIAEAYRRNDRLLERMVKILQYEGIL